MLKNIQPSNYLFRFLNRTISNILFPKSENQWHSNSSSQILKLVIKLCVKNGYIQPEGCLFITYIILMYEGKS